MTSFLIATALKDFVRAKRIVVWILIVAALYGISHAFLYVSPDISKKDAYIQLSGLMVYRVLALAAAIFSSAVISQEIEQKTIVYLITRPIPRPILLMTRLAATAIVVFGVGMLAAISVSFATHGAGGLSNPILMRDAKALLIGAAAYSALFTFFSLIMNRSMLLSLFFAFIWESFIPNLPGDMYRVSIYTYLKAVAERPVTDEAQSPLGYLSGQAGPDLVLPTTGYLTMAVFVVGMTMLSAWWFKNFEYLPREDAE